MCSVLRSALEKKSHLVKIIANKGTADVGKSVVFFLPSSNFLGSIEAISEPQSSEFDQSSIYGCRHVSPMTVLG